MALLLTAGFGPTARAAQAQALGVDRTIPPMGYYSAFNLLYDGDYDLALKAFEADSRSSIKTAQSRWIDSICYETMCGECLFQMGRFREALDHYTAALSIDKSFSDWMIRVQFSPTIRPSSAGARKLVPWGVSKRQVQVGNYQRAVLLFQGQIDATQVVQQGGVVQQANGFPVTPQEIVRCTALAMRRRATLLGPACKYDSLTSAARRWPCDGGRRCWARRANTIR
jgi:tetratricopeptide (TPR) repeat protein